MSKCNKILWERQKGESAQAFEAFITYRDMGAGRSLRAVSQKLDKSKTIIDRWSRTHDWVERVRAYDNELEKEARAKAVKGRKEMIDRHIKIAMRLQEKAFEAFDNLKIEEMSAKEIKEFIKMATELERLNRTLEDDGNNCKSDTSASLADTVIAAYKRRMENDNQ